MNQFSECTGPLVDETLHSLDTLHVEKVYKNKH